MNFKNKFILSLAAITSLTILYGDDATTKLDDVTVVVSASGFEQNIEDAPATMSVITAQEIQKRSYSDITDVLKNVPGVFVTGGGSNQSIMMRGMGDDYTLYLIDGKPMQNDQAFTQNGGQAGVQMNFLPSVENIERVEVIRGPASALYGSDAMGGVINIITKKHGKKASGGISLEYIIADSNNETNNDAMNTSFYLNGPVIKDVLSFGITAGFNYTDESSYQAGSTESGGSDPEYKSRKVSTKLVYTPNNENTITLEQMYNKQERVHTPGKSLEEDDDLSEIISYKDTYSISHEYNNGDDLLLKSYITYDDAKNPSRRNEETGNYIMTDTLTANTQGTIFFDKNTLSLGAAYVDEMYKDGATNRLNEGEYTTASRFQYSMFGENEWNITDDLSLFLSLRYDENEDFGSNFSPKIYAVYGLNDKFTIKGGVTTGYKAPTLKNSSDKFLSVSRGGNSFGNPDLTPETTTTYEASVAYDDGDSLGGSLTIYKTDFKDKIERSSYYICEKGTSTCIYKGVTYSVSNEYGFKERINIDDAEVYGLELTTDYQISENVKYRQSYTYTDSEIKSGTDKGEPLNDMSQHMFNAGIDWDVNNKLSCVVYKLKKNIRLKGGIYNLTNNEVTTEDYNYVLDGRRFSFGMDMTF